MDVTAGDPRPFRSADRLLRALARRGAPWLLVLLLAEAVGAAATLSLPSLLGSAVDEVLGGGPALAALARLAGVLAIDAAAVVVGIAAAARLTAGATAWLRRGLLRHVLILGPDVRREHSAADLTSRLVSDTQPAVAVAPVLLGCLSAVATAVGGIVALALLDWQLAVVLGVGLPLAWLAVRVLVSDVSQLFVRYSVVLAGIAGRLARALGGARTIRASGTVVREGEHVLAPLAELAAAGHGIWRAQRRASSQLGTLNPLIAVAVLAVAGIGVADGRITPGDFVAAGAYTTLALGLFNSVEALIDLAHARAGAARLTEVLDEPLPPLGAAALPPGRGELLLRSVTVRDGERVVLDRVDLHVPGGTTIAVVDAEGSGAAALAMVASGLRTPDHGDAVVDGVPVRALAPAVLPQAVACAFAGPTLLGAPASGGSVGTATVADAIALGRPATVPAEVVAAATIAHADAFVRRLPQGYETPLADAPFSGGEAQRIGLARAFACAARVTVLDDATSNLDVATEALIGDAVTGGLAGGTRLVVTRRAATAARADAVAWLHGGRIRAVAPHAQLWTSAEYRAVFGDAGGRP